MAGFKGRKTGLFKPVRVANPFSGRLVMDTGTRRFWGCGYLYQVCDDIPDESILVHFLDSSRVRMERISFFSTGRLFTLLSQRIVGLIPKYA